MHGEMQMEQERQPSFRLWYSSTEPELPTLVTFQSQWPTELESCATEKVVIIQESPVVQVLEFSQL